MNVQEVCGRTPNWTVMLKMYEENVSHAQVRASVSFSIWAHRVSASVIDLDA